MSKLLITADWHIRSTVPSCIEATQEEWMNFQKQSVNRVLEIAKENDVDEIEIGGDLFHSETTASNECIYLLQDFAQNADEANIPVYILCGNHDLPQHSSNNIPKAAIGVLLNSKCVRNMGKDTAYVKGCDFDKEDYGDAKMIFKHVLTIPSRDKPDFIDCETPESLLEKYSSTQWVFTGDYHKNFEYNLNHRHVVNSGCLMRQAADFEDYIPGVYVVDTDKEEITFVPIGLEQKFNHNGYEKKALDQTIENFVTGIKAEDVTLDYVSSLKNEAKNHEQGIQNRIDRWIEQSGN